MPGKVEVKHAARLAAHLSMQREHGKYCDVCVCVAEKRFLAHKCVLSANSTKLDCLILEAIGQNSSSQDIEIEIQGVSPLGFETLLEHFYTGELNLTPQTVMPVWMTAAYLELPGVVSLCNDYCQRSVTCVSNLPTVEDSNKTSEVSCHNTNSTVAVDTVSSVPTTPHEISVSDANKAEITTPTNYGEISTVVPSIKLEHDPVDSTPTKQEKVVSSDNNGAVSWTALQTATRDSFQSDSSNITPEEFQSSSVTWTQSQQNWPTESYTVANTGELIKTESTCELEDGEIAVDPGTRLIPVQGHQVNTGVSFVQQASSTPPSATRTQQISLIDVNKLADLKPSEKPGCENMMLEVERLRMQHQQLQRLQQQQQQASLQGSNTFSTVHTTPLPQTTYVSLSTVTNDEPAKKKVKKKKFSPVFDNSVHKEITEVKPAIIALPVDTYSNQSITNISLHQSPVLRTTMSNMVIRSPINKPSSLSDFKIVTDEYRDELFKIYPFTREEPVAATCTAQELLQRGKPRKRKSAEHNALNTTIRLVLDTLEITESSDKRVEDALILIMDRFESLRSCINDPTVRRSLLVKVRHSIHCKKWRVKRNMQKEKMDELGITSTDEYNKLVKQGSGEDSLHGQGIGASPRPNDIVDAVYSSGTSGAFQKSPQHTFETLSTSSVN